MRVQSLRQLSRSIFQSRYGLAYDGPRALSAFVTGHVRFTPNSDIDCAVRHVRVGPTADISQRSDLIFDSDLQSKFAEPLFSAISVTLQRGRRGRNLR